jgi:hypothetical protein
MEIWPQAEGSKKHTEITDSNSEWNDLFSVQSVFFGGICAQFSDMSKHEIGSEQYP